MFNQAAPIATNKFTKQFSGIIIMINTQDMAHQSMFIWELNLEKYVYVYMTISQPDI